MWQPTVLISGAGIAGPALAHWLTKSGYRVIVVELASGVRPGGQTVDLRGLGGDVIERMGLIDVMRAHAVKQRGAAWVRSDGSRRAEMPVTAFHGNGLVSKLEIQRGDLAYVLYEATKGDAEYRFDVRISDLSQDDAGVTANLSDGTTIEADLVVGADGPHSGVRKLVFGSEDRFVQPLGGYNAWFTAPDHIGIDGWYLMYQAPGGLHASMRPTHDREVSKAGFAFRSGPLEYDRHDLDSQRRLLRERFAGQGWECDALLDAADRADDFYFDSFAQVHMDTWSKGRVTLVGDAGYCASPLSGMGTSLALVGAYILAGELGPGSELTGIDRVRSALDRYGATMRPYVKNCQELKNTLDRFAPMKESDIAANATAFKWMQKWPLRPIAEKLWFTTADSIDLPVYEKPAIG